MKVPRSILRALNVHRDEWWMVQKLFLLQFFQGAGIAFFFTSAFSRFLEHFPVSGLAYVFLLASLLLWLAGFIYNRLEHHLPPSRLYSIITGVLALSMLVFRAGAEYIQGNWFYFLMLAWFYVLYLLNNLLFWGMASQLYDVRQSKRLFGVISAGDIPAKFIGYSVALVIVSSTGTANLLLAGFLFILLSFPFLKKILDKSEKSRHENERIHTAKLQNIVKDYTVNILVRRVAVLSLIVSASMVLINYAFYAEVKSAYKNDVELARFIALFLATARLAALLIKIVITSRLLYWLGNQSALLITPILLIVLIVILLLTNTMTYNGRIVLYMFGLSAILIDVLNSAINSPVLLTIMQPLSTVKRLRAHNIVKGIMDPFAYLFCGLFLVAVFKLKLYTLQLLSLVLMFLAIAWVIGIYRTHQQYLKTLIKAISSRFFSQDDFNLYDTATRELIEEKINTGSELEVLYILKMLGTRRSEESNKLIIQALKHPSGKVAGEALRLIRELHIKEAEPFLTAIIENHPSDVLRSEAVMVISDTGFQDHVIVPLMKSSNRHIRRSAIISVLNHSQLTEYRNEAEKKVKKLLVSANTDDKKEAAEILCETHDVHFDEELVQLLNEKETALQHTVIKALGHHATDTCLKNLIKQMDDHEKQVIEALVTAREKSLPFIKKRILEEQFPGKQKGNLINATGRIGGKAAHEILFELLQDLPGYQPHIIRVLHRSRFKAGKHNQLFIESLIRHYLVAAAGVLHMQKNLLPQKEKSGVLFRSLQLELNEIRETLLYLFSFLYDREKISKIKAAIEINKKETNANAIELVDMTVKKEFANPFNASFEQGDIEHRCNLLKSIFPKDIYPGIDAILTGILADKNLFYNNWTKACSLYASKKPEQRVAEQLIYKYLHSENPLLKETAYYAAGIR